eukprot:scaffold77429_cov36-Tisochrysis_lutea.AAC.1
MHTARGDREWHITWEMLSPVLERYIQAVPELRSSSGIDCVDVGCGFSDLGLKLCQAHRLSNLWLLDASSVCIEQLRSRFSQVEGLNLVIRVADCRALPLTDRTVRLVLDKGTLDAMESDEDSRSMLSGLARILAPNGLIISISFPAVKRLALLDEYLPMLGLMHHTYVLPSADMHAAVVFLSLIFSIPADGRGASPMPNYAPDERTRRMLRCAAMSGSLYEDASDFHPPDPFDFEDANEEG